MCCKKVHQNLYLYFVCFVVSQIFGFVSKIYPVILSLNPPLFLPIAPVDKLYLFFCVFCTLVCTANLNWCFSYNSPFLFAFCYAATPVFCTVFWFLHVKSTLLGQLSPNALWFFCIFCP